MNLLLGILLTVVAGVLAGNSMLPMKFLRNWRWENVWFVFSIVSLAVLPWGLALTMVSDLGAVYGALTARAVAAPVAFGFGWGIAQVLFGLSIARLGMALGYAVIVGLSAVLGTLVPLFAQGGAALPPERLAMILSGVAIMVAGIAVSAWAGQRREARQPVSGYAGALAVAIFCGLMAPMLNYGFAFGQQIADAAVQAGNTRIAAGYAVWPVTLAGGFFPNVAYAGYLLTKNRTWDRFLPSAAEARLAVIMGLFWMGSMAIYGVAAALLGPLGTSVGWALFQIFMIMAANASGMITGEWRQVSGSTRRIFWAGFGLLAAATVVISFGNVP